MNPYPYDNGGRPPSHSPKGYGDSGNHPGRDYPEPPPQYTPPIPNPASPASSYHYPSPSNGPPAHPQSLATYNNGQTITSPNAYGTRPYPPNLNHGHYAPAPQTFHGLPAPNTGPHNAYRGPDAHDTRPYEAYGGPYAPNRGDYQVNGGPHAGDTRSYEARRDVYDPNRGSYQAHRDPRASDTGQYPSPQAPEKQRYHGAGHGIPATENSAARTRGGHTQADESDAIPVSDFKMNQTVRAQITADTWVMGVIISVAHIASKVTGRTYWVKFQSVRGQRETGEFSEAQLRPA